MRLNRDRLISSLADTQREACACLGHDVVLPATILLEHGGRLQMMAMLGDDRFAQDSLRAIDTAIRDLVQSRMDYARRTGGTVVLRLEE